MDVMQQQQQQQQQQLTRPETPEAAPPSNSGEAADSSLKTNAWANEEPRIFSSPSSQRSKASRTASSTHGKAGSEDGLSDSATAIAPATTAAAAALTTSINGARLDVPTTPNGSDVGIVVPRTRRRTITKATPHRFELADAPTGSAKRSKSSDHSGGHSRKTSAAASHLEPMPSLPARLAFSSIQTTGSIEALVSPPPRLAFSSIQTTVSQEPIVPETLVPAPTPAPAPSSSSAPSSSAPSSSAPSSPPSLGLSRVRVTASTQPIVPSSPPPKAPVASKRDSDSDVFFDSSFVGTFMSPTPSDTRPQSSFSINGSKSATAPATFNPALSPNCSFPTPYHFLPPPNPLSREHFNSKVVVITHGASQISSLLVRAFHDVGCRIIFGDPSPERARKLVSSLGPLDIVHYNKCDVGSYSDILDLFQLAMTMYGRVDHAIFGVADDGAQASSIRSAEALWRLDDVDHTKLRAKERMQEVGSEPPVNGFRMYDIITASTRFARIALPFLQKGHKPNTPHMDKSLTLMASSASFTPMPNLPVYQISQHVVLGTVRALAQTIDPLHGGGGVRVNGVVTNMMIPTLVPQNGGKVGVQLPPDRPEDVSQVVLGVVGSGSALASSSSVHTRLSLPSLDGIDDNNSLHNEQLVHGKILYVAGEHGAYDLQDGLDTATGAWMGPAAKEYFDSAQLGYGNGAAIQWMLAD